MAEINDQFNDESFTRLDEVFDLVEVWRDRVQGPSPEPTPGSSLAADDAATTPYTMSHAVVAALCSAVDHLDALRVLIQEADTVHSRAPYTLMRAALENAAIAVWLLAPASRKERVLRRLRLQWADDNDYLQVSALLHAPEDERLGQVKTELRRIAENQGLNEDQVRQVAARPPGWGSIVETAGDEVDGLSGPDTKLCWMVGSGIAHARSWATLGAMQLTETRVTENGVIQAEFRASSTVVVAIARTTALVLTEGWRLFDQRRQVHIQPVLPT